MMKKLNSKGTNGHPIYHTARTHYKFMDNNHLRLFSRAVVKEQNMMKK